MVPANVNKQLMNHLPDRADLCVDPGNHLHRREESIGNSFSLKRHLFAITACMPNHGFQVEGLGAFLV